MNGGRLEAMKLLLVILALMALGTALFAMGTATTVFHQDLGVGFLQAGAVLLGAAGIIEAIEKATAGPKPMRTRDGRIILDATDD